MAYVKNHGLGFEVRYAHKGQERKYRPDFIVKLDVGEPEPLNLLVEIKGVANEVASAENDTMTSLRLPGVDNHGRFGRWHFVAIRDIFGAAQQLDEAIAGLRQVRAA